jgi:predicted DNA-binding transcriptional regulator AlpA
METEPLWRLPDQAKREVKFSLLTKPEVTRELRVSPATLDRLLRRGDGPPAVRIGGRVYFPADKFSGWLATRPNPFEKGSAAA